MKFLVTTFGHRNLAFKFGSGISEHYRHSVKYWEVFCSVVSVS